MTKKPIFALMFVSCLAVALVACGKKEAPNNAAAPSGDTVATPAPASAPVPVAVPAPVAVANITLGNAIDAGKKVTAPLNTFAKTDTIYASIDTTGVGAATLKVTWTFHKGDKVATVKEDTATISPTAPATTEFHISKSGGWPAGSYQLAVTLDGKPVGTKDFSVK